MDANEEQQFGARRTAKIHQPMLPSNAEMEEHALTHLPFWIWCEHCVKGRGDESAHRRIVEMPEPVEIHIVFCSPGEEKDGGKLTILVERGRRTKMTMSTGAPCKSSGEFLGRRVVAFLKEIGGDQGDITIKTWWVEQAPRCRRAALAEAVRATVRLRGP